MSTFYDPATIRRLAADGDAFYRGAAWILDQQDAAAVATAPTELGETTSSEDLYALALWHVYGILGFDTDGDVDPGAVIAGMGPRGYAQLIIDSAREHATDYDNLIMRVPEEYL